MVSFHFLYQWTAEYTWGLLGNPIPRTDIHRIWKTADTPRTTLQKMALIAGQT
jgi:hypothetical protein